MDFKNLVSSAKGVFFEEEVASKPISSPIVKPTPIPFNSNTFPAAFTQAGDNSTVSNSEKVAAALDRLKKKTDFDITPIGSKVKEVLANLENLPLNDAQKMDLVIKMGAKDNVTKESILSALQGLISALDSEKDKFIAYNENRKKDSVQSKRDAVEAEAVKIRDLQAQISASQQKQSELSAELIQAESEIRTAESAFLMAYTTRKSELESTVQHYTSVLQG